MIMYDSFLGFFRHLYFSPTPNSAGASPKKGEPLKLWGKIQSVEDVFDPIDVGNPRMNRPFRNDGYELRPVKTVIFGMIY